MLVSQGFGIGLLTAIGQKIAYDFLDAEEKKMNDQINDRMNGFRIPLFGLMNLDVNLPNQAPAPHEDRFYKLVDQSSILLTVGNSFINPVFAFFSAGIHFSLKYQYLLLQMHGNWS